MIIFSPKDQKILRIQMAIKRINRTALSAEINISQPTVKKLLDDPCPLAISQETSIRLERWAAANAKVLSDLINCE